jgi:hypothetical protein
MRQKDNETLSQKSKTKMKEKKQKKEKRKISIYGKVLRDFINL